MQPILRKIPHYLRSATLILKPPARHTAYKPPFTQEFTVSPFSNLKIECNFNVALQPLSVSKYMNQDRVIINTLCHKTSDVPTVDCQQNGDEIAIKSNGNSTGLCVIVEAPIKANFDVVVGGDGCVSVGSFENDFLNVQTTKGNIELEKFQSGDVNIVSVTGDVICKRNTQATQIRLKTKSGSIRADKLQGKQLVVETESGDVTTQASYCDSSCFRSKTGNFYLQNVHKTCEIDVEDGFVSLLVFDGTLGLNLKRGKVDVVLSRILGDSRICVEEEGCLSLKIVESCFDGTAFRFETSDLKNNGGFDLCEDGGFFAINPKLKQENVVNVNCKEVNVERISVLELFRLLK